MGSIVGIIDMFLMLEQCIDDLGARVRIGISEFCFDSSILFSVAFRVLFGRIFFGEGITGFPENITASF